MTDLLPPLPLFEIFLAASFALAVTPGPGVLYIVTRSISQGRMAGLASVAGVALGNFGNALGASLGLAALFAISHMAFMLVKYLGALYLLYIGIKTIRSAKTAKTDDATTFAAKSPKSIFMDGFIVALFNPKTTLFFAAFLPQFIQADYPPVLQSTTLGAIFVLIAATTDTCYALLANVVRPFFAGKKHAGAMGKYISGGTFIGLGLLTALSGQRRK